MDGSIMLLNDKIRRLPDVAPMRSGAIQFGEDWPGVFIRGDEIDWLIKETWLVLDQAKKLGAPEKTIKLLTIIHDDFKRLEAESYEPKKYNHATGEWEPA
jgi:hypothetical protein